VFELLHETCAIPDMTPVPKLASQALLVPFIMVVFIVIHTVGRMFRWLGSRDRTTGHAPRSATTDGGSSALDVKLASGFITTLLFMYQKMGTTVSMSRESEASPSTNSGLPSLEEIFPNS